MVILDSLYPMCQFISSSRATVQTISKVLLEEIVPLYGVVNYIDSDQRTHFTSKIIKQLVEALGIRWEYHTLWLPQSLGQVERMNQMLKAQSSKLILETLMSWLKCLPLALLNIKIMPHSETGLSPFEMLYGMPNEHGMPVRHFRLEDSQIQPYLIATNKNLQELRKQKIVMQSAPLGLAIHKMHLGDKVLIKSWKEVALLSLRRSVSCPSYNRHSHSNSRERLDIHVSGENVEHWEEIPEWKITSSPGD